MPQSGADPALHPAPPALLPAPPPLIPARTEQLEVARPAKELGWVPLCNLQRLSSTRANECNESTARSCPNMTRKNHHLLGWRALLAQGTVESSSGTKVFRGIYGENAWTPIANEP